MASSASWSWVSLIGGFVAVITDVLIGEASAQHVLIRPLSRSSPGLFDDRDGNWIECEIEIVAGGFRGEFTADMRSEEFHAFMDQVSELGRTVDGAASFTTMEGQLALSLTADRSGRIRIAGEALDLAGSENRLAFRFDVEDTCLPEMSRSLESLLAAFPVVGTPEA
jgi:hypothetical protein